MKRNKRKWILSMQCARVCVCALNQLFCVIFSFTHPKIWMYTRTCTSMHYFRRFCSVALGCRWTILRMYVYGFFIYGGIFACIWRIDLFRLPPLSLLIHFIHAVLDHEFNHITQYAYMHNVCRFVGWIWLEIFFSLFFFQITNAICCMYLCVGNSMPKNMTGVRLLYAFLCCIV